MLSLPLFLAIASAPIDHPHTYLLSVGGFPLGKNESVERFSFSTWGAQFGAVCRIPRGWTIKAGSGATPDGVLEGEGSLGATWFVERNPRPLRNLVLITLYGVIQHEDRGAVPATFKGVASISTDDSNHHDKRRVLLSYRNVTLIPARRCPA